MLGKYPQLTSDTEGNSSLKFSTFSALNARGRVTEPGLYSRRASRYTRDVRHLSLLLATGDLQRILQA